VPLSVAPNTGFTGSVPMSPTATPDAVSPCGANPGMWCDTTYSLTHTVWLSKLAQSVLGPAVAILVIVVVAVLLRWAVHRAITKMAGDAATGRVPALLRPLKERAAGRLQGSGLSERRAQRARTIGSLLKSVASLVIYGIAFVLALTKLGINVAPIIASAGVVGVAVGFGAQNLVKDFLSGIFMMLEDQYGVGDVIDCGTASGTVEAVGLRITTLRDVEGTVWYVRNGIITAVGNSTQRFAVAVVDVPIGYSSDIEQAGEIAEKAARDAVARLPLSEDVLDQVEMLGVQSLTHEAITLRVTVKTKPGRQFAVRRALTAELIGALDAAGVPAPMAAVLPSPLPAHSGPANGTRADG
jgi:small-conductance mechanosensitive channel